MKISQQSEFNIFTKFISYYWYKPLIRGVSCKFFCFLVATYIIYVENCKKTVENFPLERNSIVHRHSRLII